MQIEDIVLFINKIEANLQESALQAVTVVIDQYGNFHLTDTDTDMLIITYTDTDTDKKKNKFTDTDTDKKKRNSQIPI